MWCHSNHSFLHSPFPLSPHSPSSPWPPLNSSPLVPTNSASTVRRSLSSHFPFAHSYQLLFNFSSFFLYSSFYHHFLLMILIIRHIYRQYVLYLFSCFSFNQLSWRSRRFAILRSSITHRIMLLSRFFYLFIFNLMFLNMLFLSSQCIWFQCIFLNFLLDRSKPLLPRNTLHDLTPVSYTPGTPVSSEVLHVNITELLI